MIDRRISPAQYVLSAVGLLVVAFVLVVLILAAV